MDICRAAEQKFSGCAAIPKDQRIRVFLRVRPFTTHELRAIGPQEAGEANTPDEKHVLRDPRISSILDLDQRSISLCPYQAHVLGSEIRETGVAFFEFDRVFASVSQEELFNKTVAPLVDQLFEGSSGLAFAHGTTNSGKTYTMYGRRHDPGLIWKGFARVFQRAYGGSVVCGKLPLSAEEASRLAEMRRWVSQILSAHDALNAHMGDQLQPANQQRDFTDLGSGSLQSYNGIPVQFLVRVSALEIYNDQIYDLLREPALPQSQSSMKKSERERSDRCQRRRLEPTQLRDDWKGNLVLDLKPVCVTSIEDVEMVMKLAASNRKTAQSARNQHSSRSHSAFTIHLTKLSKEPPASTDISSRTEWQSTLAFVDLAGAERAPPNASAVQVREAAQINTSLMHLGRCLEIMRLNHANVKRHSKMRSQLVPFRQSRLTRLFQKLMEAGSVTMIACISPFRLEANETIHALRCAAVAKQVRHEHKRTPLSEIQTPKIRPSTRVPDMQPKTKLLTQRTTRIEAKENSVWQPKSSARFREGSTGRSEDCSFHGTHSTTRASIENEIRKECAEEMERAIASIRKDYEERISALEAELRQHSQQRIALATNTVMREREHYRHALADARADIELLEKQLREARGREEQLVATIECLRKESSSLPRARTRRRGGHSENPSADSSNDALPGSDSSRPLPHSDENGHVERRLRRQRRTRSHTSSILPPCSAMK
jgi:hypothetical protein